ncbi:hypothetical protein [Intrasporangium flavum]|uniref:hypothetical protein n=1 Tax=Intrasporangium flavum TaxID=1428657 RepID=UPI00096DF082|nr:hypothetical protein [Intrasporangium flavum]
MKAALLLVAFVAGGGLTWLLTVHRVTREIAPDATDATEPSDFAGARSGESSGSAGSRWMSDAEDEDALLPHAATPAGGPGTAPPA